MKLTELRGKQVDELNKLLADTRQELTDARRGLAAGELANPRTITNARKSIAQIMTVMSETLSQEEEKK